MIPGEKTTTKKMIIMMLIMIMMMMIMSRRRRRRCRRRKQIGILRNSLLNDAACQHLVSSDFDSSVKKALPYIICIFLAVHGDTSFFNTKLTRL